MFAAATLRAARICGCVQCRQALAQMREEEMLVVAFRRQLDGRIPFLNVVERISAYTAR